MIYDITTGTFRALLYICLFSLVSIALIISTITRLMTSSASLPRCRARRRGPEGRSVSSDPRTSCF